MKTFKTAIKRRDAAYKEYVKAQKTADRLMKKVQDLEHSAKSLQSWDDKMELHFPISINFSGYED